MSSIVEKATGKRLDPDLIEQTVRRVVEDKLAGPPVEASRAPAPKPTSGDGKRAEGKPAALPDDAKPQAKPKPKPGPGDGEGT